MDYQNLVVTLISVMILVIIFAVGIFAFRSWGGNISDNVCINVGRKQRRDYYRSYLQSDDWKRKRYVVLKRYNWRCVYCGARATQVHHKRYAKRNIGKEPIEWLVSVCKDCHNSLHY